MWNVASVNDKGESILLNCIGMFRLKEIVIGMFRLKEIVIVIINIVIACKMMPEGK